MIITSPISRRQMMGGLVATATGPTLASDDTYKNFGRRLGHLGARAVVVLHRGRESLSQGDVRRPLRAASIRKSLLSALYGIAVEDGTISLDATLNDLGIRSLANLTRDEARAKVRHLLQSRSGIYLPAAAETQSQIENRPRRGSSAPGESWHYNNWDFNVLGRIYETSTGENLFRDLERKIADPLGWRDFNRGRHTRWQREPRSTPFPAYNLDISARDLARFGALYLNGGRWNGRSILTRDWIRQSTQAHSQTRRDGLMSGYGYMWWVARDWQEAHGLTAYTAVGNGGRYLTVVPDLELVIAVQPNERQGWPAVPLYADRCAYSNEVGRLIHDLGGPALGRSCR